MSLLSDRDIRQALLTKQIQIEPYDGALLQPASIDVRLGNMFRVFGPGHIDPKVEHPTELVEVPDGTPFTLLPGQFALGSTAEHLTLDDSLAARVEGKSSLGRLGLLAHATAGFIDPGFAGQITLELASLARPLKLWPGMKIAQLCFFDLTSRAIWPYGTAGNHYQDQTGPTASKAHLQFSQT